MNQDAFIFGLAIVALVWYLVPWSISILGCIAARRRYRSRPMSPLSRAGVSNSPGVSILRPLKGLDTNLYENLESTFKQEYSNYEIIFSVADENDQALNIVHALINRYPLVKVTIITGEEVVGVNPKVNNLVRPFRTAANDILWVLDSGVMVDSGTLARSVDILTGLSTPSGRKVALVHHVPLALIDEPKIGSRLETAFLNTNHAKMYIAINTIGIDSCVVGKSNLYRRSDIERLNGSLVPIQSQPVSTQEPIKYGLAAFGRFLAEDNMIASALWHELGLRHDLSCDVARNVIGNMSFLDYVWRRVRWIRVRKRMVLAATLLEPFTESVMLCIIGSFACSTLFTIPTWIFVLVHFTTWLCVDLDVYTSIAGRDIWKDGILFFLLAWMAREILAFPVWLLGIVADDVTWRGRRYTVMSNGEARLCTT
ncbi:glycosyltransferase family 21 protein [Gymnopilus junonius]|uniref:Ceramide glucosyltransferase n=1 Tax=Gymnopilus junonius TaxID=109634 RepID=A0A9P5NYM1_GYMJU|nr:glycosyltransferase family 21 protein [Gymnopilus junonius]